MGIKRKKRSRDAGGEIPEMDVGSGRKNTDIYDKRGIAKRTAEGTGGE